MIFLICLMVFGYFAIHRVLTHFERLEDIDKLRLENNKLKELAKDGE